MRALAVSPPSRFPTVVHDPGIWWDIVSSFAATELHRHSLNYDWWTLACGPDLIRTWLEPFSTLERWHQKASWRVSELDVKAKARASARGLSELQDQRIYASLQTYLAALDPLAQFLDIINQAQSEFSLDVIRGPRVRSLNYGDSKALVDYSKHRGLLARTIAAAVDKMPSRYDLYLFSITSPEDLLTAAIASRQLRARNADCHISLIDHGYENFSLHSSIDLLRGSGALETVFDTIVISKDERDEVVPALVKAVARKAAPRGYITRANFPDDPHQRSAPPPDPMSAPPLPVFSASRILWTRLSNRRCYWSRCTFCTQNAKYDRHDAPSQTEIRANLKRIASYSAAAGYDHVIFSDEAISPSALRLLAEEMERGGYTFKWACRCKAERQHSAALMQRIAKAGCIEILYGLESTSPRVLALMDKSTEGVDDQFFRKLFHAMSEAGIGLHVNLLAGFPGDSLREVEESVAFVIDAIKPLRGATYILNLFNLFPDTPVAQTPERFGLVSKAQAGDVPLPLRFDLEPAIADEHEKIRKRVPELRRRLSDELGWSGIAEAASLADLAQSLYFATGHGIAFKGRADNPLANPLAPQRIVSAAKA